MSDIATALDHVLGDPKTEAKFQALKVLHAKKIKSLMGSIDSQQKEIGKLKTLSKDNRRTQIIQSLKKKLREQELVSDVLKEELERKLEWDHQEVNDFVIRKTISGPKRFRPLTREELENQIAELEKKSKSKHSSTAASGTVAPSGTSKRSKSQFSPSNSKKGAINTDGAITADDPEMILKISELQESAMKLQQDCDRKDGVITQLKQEVSRVRAANSQLMAGEEDRDILERQYNDLNMNYDRTVEELEEALQKLAVVQEECFQVRAQAELELEQQTLELETLRDQCEKGLKQNTQLLRRMAELESSRGGAGKGGMGGGSSSQAALHIEAGGSPGRLTQLQEKLRLANARIATLESASRGPDPATQAVVDNLKASLREKNEDIRDLKRTVAELSRTRSGRKGEGGLASSGNFHGDIAESKTIEDSDRPGSKGAKQSKGSGAGDEGVQSEVVRLADKLVDYELHVLEKTDPSRRLPVDGEMIQTVNSLLVALNAVMNVQLRARQSDGASGPNGATLSSKKLQVLEHQMLMRYDVPGVSTVQANDDDDDTLQGEVL